MDHCKAYRLSLLRVYARRHKADASPVSERYAMFGNLRSIGNWRSLEQSIEAGSGGRALRTKQHLQRADETSE